MNCKKVLIGLAMATSTLMLNGCATRITDFTVISTKNANVQAVKTGNRVEGEDCVPVVLFPLGMVNMKEAIDRAIENAGAGYDALVDGVVTHKNYSFIFGQICMTVEGTPIATK